MNKIEFVKKITETSVEKVNQKQVNAVLSAIEEVVKDVVISGDYVVVPGICKVQQKLVKERKGKIIVGDRKGQHYVIPEHKEGSVKIVKSLKKVFE